MVDGLKVGDDIEIKFTGLKPGEKLFEELQHHNERHLPTKLRGLCAFPQTGMHWPPAPKRSINSSRYYIRSVQIQSSSRPKTSSLYIRCM